MALAGWIAVTALLLAALGLVVRNFFNYQYTNRLIHELADRLGANFEHKEGRDILTWRNGQQQFVFSLHRTALGRVEKLNLTMRDGEKRPSCRMVKRAGEAVMTPGEIATGPHALGHRHFDKLARVLGVTNPGVRERLLELDRPDALVNLFNFGFEEIELCSELVIATRIRPTTPETLTRHALGEWTRLLGML